MSVFKFVYSNGDEINHHQYLYDNLLLTSIGGLSEPIKNYEPKDLPIFFSKLGLIETNGMDYKFGPLNIQRVGDKHIVKFTRNTVLILPKGSFINAEKSTLEECLGSLDHCLVKSARKV